MSDSADSGLEAEERRKGDGFVESDPSDASDGGLFGSDDEDQAPSKPSARHLDDEELDSGDDEGRPDRTADAADDGEGEADADEMEEDHNIMDLKFGIHAVPEGSDGETYLLKFPSFMGIEPMCHDDGFVMPVTDHHFGDAPPSSTFSPYAVATSTVRWRHSEKDPSILESNARIIRWSDGDLTFQYGGNPAESFELPAKSLAPLRTPSGKPTPHWRQGRDGNSGSYRAEDDSHTYLTTTHESAGLLRATHHITTSLNLLSSSIANDDALAKLQNSLAAAVRGNKTTADGTLNILNITEDPELAKKKAEQAEKEQLRAARKMQQSQMRDAERTSRQLAKHGLGRSAGLSVDDLEEDGRYAAARKRSGATAPRRKAPKRGDSDTDDDMPRGRTREDEYDKTDDFLVDSDEEEEEMEGDGDDDEDDDGEEELLDDAPRASTSKSKAKAKADAETDADEDGAAAAAGPRTKRRRVVDDDEEDD
ncbi:MAG: hypothetical protein M1838_002900 [Thelocarpon superellum]|nr:MAG: hypothetical protein M1838_002900 [Thelocarpon superellum]